MKIAGIIAEYNPFHSGHEYHIAQTRARTGCGYVVCVMSGAFTQRGEPALMDKFARAECALNAGADAVFELPALYAVRYAQAFACGGVSILTALGADYISFGCETIEGADALNMIARAAELLDTENGALSEHIKRGLAEGKSHARARGEALARALGVHADALNQPNLILAIEYARAINKLGGAITPIAIPRAGDYHAQALPPRDHTGEYGAAQARFASAKAMRRALLAGEIKSALAMAPLSAREIIEREAHSGGFARPEALDALTLYALRAMTKQDAALLPDAGEGLGERIHALSKCCASREELITRVKCKRYTYARISRVLTYALLGVTNDMAANAPEPYLRLIGFRADKSELLRELKRRAGDTPIRDAAALEGSALFDIEKRATDTWGLATSSAKYRRAGRDRTRKFLVV